MNQRPVGVIILYWFYLVFFAIGAAWTMILYFGPKGEYDAGFLGYLFGSIPLLWGLFNLLIAIGLSGLKHWGRILCMITHVLTVILGGLFVLPPLAVGPRTSSNDFTYAFALGGIIPYMVYVVIATVVILYLMRPKVKERFR